MLGKIKNVIADKGYGFIIAEDGKEYFFHHSALLDGAIGDLKKGFEVSFKLGQGPKGPRAEDVTTRID